MADELDTGALLVSNLISIASISALTFGVESAHERAMRFLRQAYRKHVEHARNGQLPGATFFDFCLRIPGLDDPAHVWVSYWEGLALHYTDPCWVDTTDPVTGQLQPTRYHLLAVNATRPELVIPSRLWVPYEGTRRSERELDNTWMLPTYFPDQDGSVGVPLMAGERELLHLSDASTGFDKQTVYLHLHLYNYKRGRLQIRLRNGPTERKPSIRVLARQIAAIVRELISDLTADDVTPGMEQWMFGIGEGQIGLEDIVLFGFVHVSQGTITPLLGLRPDYQFSSSETLAEQP